MAEVVLPSSVMARAFPWVWPEHEVPLDWGLHRDALTDRVRCPWCGRLAMVRGFDERLDPHQCPGSGQAVVEARVRAEDVRRRVESNRRVAHHQAWLRGERAGRASYDEREMHRDARRYAIAEGLP